MMPERQDTNEVKPRFVSTWCLRVIPVTTQPCWSPAYDSMSRRGRAESLQETKWLKLPRQSRADERAAETDCRDLPKRLLGNVSEHWAASACEETAWSWDGAAWKGEKEQTCPHTGPLVLNILSSLGLNLSSCN